MEKITQTPGLHHIAENIFIYLSHETLLECRKVNEFWRQILQNPTFWVKICATNGLSKDNQMKWNALIQVLEDPSLKENVTEKLMEIHKGGIVQVFQHPFHNAWKSRELLLVEKYLEKVDPKIIEEGQEYHAPMWGYYANGDSKYSYKEDLNPVQIAAFEGDYEALKIFVRFSGNPNAPDGLGYTPIQRIVDLRGYNYENGRSRIKSGHLKVLRILAPLAKNPNARDPKGWPPIAKAAFAHYGYDETYTDIVKILIPYSDNPNAAAFDNMTPFQRAIAKNFNIDVIRLLLPFVENPNTPLPFCRYGGNWTPLQLAAYEKNEAAFELFAPFVGNPHDLDPYGESLIQRVAMRGTVKMMKLLIPLTDNINAPNANGFTPIMRAHSRPEMMKLLAPFSTNPNAPDPHGWTPIQLAVLQSSLSWKPMNVCDEIVSILGPKTDNPNAPDPIGVTPIQRASMNGHSLKMEVESKIRRIMPRRKCKTRTKRIFQQEKNMKDVAAAAPAKKAALQLKKSSGAHPPTFVMIKSAITALGDKKGSSLAAIKKYVKSNYHVDIVKISPFICKALKKGVESKNLVQIKRSYKLAKEVEKPTKSNKVIVPKTKEVKKSKAKNKKAAAKPKNVKKAATKPVKKLAAITKCGSGFSYT